MGAPFISRQDLSDYLGKDVTADDGATIAVDSACDMVRTLTEQDFDAATETITLDGTGTDALVLPQLPVSAAGTVALISSSGGTTAVTDYALNGHGILLRTRGSHSVAVWPAGRQNVEVTYDHGYGTADFPADVRMVALSVASRLIVQGPALEENLGDSHIVYAGAATDFTSGEKLILGRYRQIG